jgi:hypothetical protein
MIWSDRSRLLQLDVVACKRRYGSDFLASSAASTPVYRLYQEAAAFFGPGTLT